MNLHNVTLEKTAYRPGDYPKRLPEFAFVGRSNVGKSSMLNKLLGRKHLARVSGEPGTTRSINFYNIDDTVYLTDLPGYGFAKVSWSDREKWRAMIEHYFAAGRDIRLVIMIVDIRHKPSQEDRVMVDYLLSTEYDFLVCASKADKLSGTAARRNCAMIAGELGIDAQVLPFSAKTGEGRESILNLIKERQYREISEI